eukprot:368961-Pelagomonas_calceolata.AAC.2
MQRKAVAAAAAAVRQRTIVAAVAHSTKSLQQQNCLCDTEGCTFSECCRSLCSANTAHPQAGPKINHPLSQA